MISFESLYQPKCKCYIFGMLLKACNHKLRDDLSFLRIFYRLISNVHQNKEKERLQISLKFLVIRENRKLKIKIILVGEPNYALMI